MPVKCVYENNGEKCMKRAIYNFPGNPKSYCSSHKKERMINVNYKYSTRKILGKNCMIENCKKQRTHNFPEEKALYCGQHKKEGMIDTRYKKKCNEKDCINLPTFGFADEKALYCGQHKKEGMISKRKPRKKCIENHCNLFPSFNYPEKTNTIYCSKHKKDRMVSLYGLCEIFGCNKCASFGNKNKVKSRCSLHKEEDMISYSICKYPGCVVYPIYSYEGKSKLYCFLHKKEGMIDVKHTLCKAPECTTRIHPYCEGYCSYCFINLFPGDERINKLRKKTKEIEVKNYLINNKLDFIHDKPIYLGDCSTNRRVDFYKYIGEKHILCIEVDENQHKWYDPFDEDIRYNDLYKLGYNMIFLRYNPDKYIRNGIVKNTSSEIRLNFLIKMINKIKQEIEEGKYSEKPLYIKYLYYDRNKKK